MSTEAFIKFFFMHINTIIFVSALITVLMIAVIAYLNLGKESEGQGPAFDGSKLGDLENLLKRMIDTAQMPKVATVSGAPIPSPSAPVVLDTPVPAPTPVAPAGASPADVAALNEAKAESQNLKNLISEKEATIAKLKSSLELAQQDQIKKSAASPSQQMQDKLRELEAKLAEYEIIEDDIADLTMYKEENAQLKEQIKNLMNNPGAAAGIPAPAPAPVAPAAPVTPAVSSPAPDAASSPAAESTAPAPASAAPTPDVPSADSTPAPAADSISDDVLEEFKAALTAQKASTPPPAPAMAAPVSPPTSSAPSPEVASNIDDDLMAEFEKALSEQKKTTSDPIVVEGVIPNFPLGDAEGAETHDIMAEFVTNEAPEEGAAAPTNVQLNIDSTPSADALLTPTDPSKMISEVESLGADATSTEGNALEDNTDPDKMLAEMEEFKKLAGSGN